MMGVARDHLPEERSAAVIALISVVSIIGADVGYPLAALLAELGGVRAAYGLGLVDVRAVRHPAFAGANLAMFVGGIGMYLLLTLITRYGPPLPKVAPAPK